LARALAIAGIPKRTKRTVASTEALGFATTLCHRISAKSSTMLLAGG